MYISTCWAYTNIQFEFMQIGDDIHLSLSNKRDDQRIGVTLSLPQMVVLADGIREAILAMGLPENNTFAGEAVITKQIELSNTTSSDNEADDSSSAKNAAA